MAMKDQHIHNPSSSDRQTSSETAEFGQGRTSEEVVDGSARFCSVKGCKAVIPVSYEYKMCPPCRTRYRTYGNTKRAKWKAERDAFDREMASLRIVEDERRKANGLGVNLMLQLMCVRNYADS
ncbi:hypothetical protein BYT27DRAFT_6337559 [Phlegmacium glaucopus]|nr:hypothetical protein BYT27DRAFT_6337559 [Phlegmacium glaucopus]